MMALTRLAACCGACGALLRPPVETFVTPTDATRVYKVDCLACGLTNTARFNETQERKR